MRFVSTLLLVVLLTMPVVAGAQKLPPACAYAQRPLREITVDTNQWPRRPFDVLSYNLTMDWRPIFVHKTPMFSGQNIIRLRLLDTARTVELDAANMRIDTVLVDGVMVTPPPQPDSVERLHVDLGSLRATNQEIELRIAYTHTSTNPELGLHFYPKGTLFQPDNDTVEEDVAYTMSEPLDAHRWMPCMDLPYDKAQSDITVIVPAGIEASSNGLLQSETALSDGSIASHWKSDKPIATYLMVANASRFEKWKDYYHRVSDPADSVPVLYYAWARDVSGAYKYNAPAAYKKTPQMMAAFSSHFGEYPFAKYGMVPVEPFVYGGMEHQSLTTIRRIWLNGNYESGIAHELMHQWFGDKTTCETWADIWLNEGFATYGENIWRESDRGYNGYVGSIRGQAYDFFHSNSVRTIPVYDPPIENIFNYATTYLKGSLMLHMLRRFMDDDTAFFATIREYSAAYAYTTANTAQFRDFVHARVGARYTIPLYEFINQWIFQPDWPEYEFTWAQSPAGELVIQANQHQTATDHYSTRLRFRAFSHGDVTELVFDNTARDQRLTRHLDVQIDSLQFDDFSTILSTYTLANDARLTVNEPVAAANSRISVSSENGLTKLSFLPVASEGGTLRIVDLLGRTVLSDAIPAGSRSYSLPGRTLANGMYYVSYYSGTEARSTRLVITN